MNRVKTSVSELYLDENGIIHVSFPIKDSKISLGDAREMYEKRVELSGNNMQQLLLSDMRTDPKPSREAQNFLRSQRVIDSTKAVAMLVGGTASKLLGNFFLGFSKKGYPVKLFTEKEDAINWLMLYK